MTLSFYLILFCIYRDKNRPNEWKYGEDGIKITVPPRVLNSSESINTFWCGTDDVSWETQEEFYTLSDAISQDDIMGLRPIFRKDLPHNYVAYWEAKINGKTGEKYVIISAGMCSYIIYNFLVGMRDFRYPLSADSSILRAQTLVTLLKNFVKL